MTEYSADHPFVGPLESTAEPNAQTESEEPGDIGPAINELVSLLAEARPESLVALQTEFPEYARSFLRAGVPWGPSSGGDGHRDLNAKALRAKAKVAHASIPPLLKRCSRAMNDMKRKLNVAGRLLTISNVATAVGSLGILGMFAAADDVVMKHAAGAVAAIGNLAAVVGQQALRNERQKENGILDDYEKVVDAHARIDGLQRAFDQWQATGYVVSDSDAALIEQLNKVAAEIARLIPATPRSR